MKVKLANLDEPGTDLLATYDALDAPAPGDFVKLPGESQMWLVTERVWMIGHDEVIVGVVPPPEPRRSWLRALAGIKQ